jgi:glycosyltransferase involved in cell wall biosynthesis
MTNQGTTLHIGINALQVRTAKSGVGQYIAGLVQGLLELEEFNRAGARLTLVARQENADNYRFDHPAYTVETFGPWGEPMALRRVREWLYLHRFIRQLGINVWHGPSNFLPLRRVPGCAYLVTLHDVSYWLQPERVPLIKSLYWRAWTHRTIQVADHFITASRHARHSIGEVLGVPPHRFTLVPHATHAHFQPNAELHQGADAYWKNPPTCGVAPSDEQKNRLDPASRELFQKFDIEPGGYLLSIATLEPGKNLISLIRAFAELRERYPADSRIQKMKLLLVGDQGWLMSPLHAEVEKTGLTGRVIFTGHLPDDHLPILLNGAALFGFLSLNEGFGLPPLEALACGTPVVASNASSLPEVLGEAAILVPPCDIEAITNAMEKVLCNSDIRPQLRCRGPIQAGRFSWKETARQTFAEYQRMFNEIRNVESN